jgi:hypothetical protein
MEADSNSPGGGTGIVDRHVQATKARDGLLAQLKDYGCTIDLADVTYFVGHETVTRREDGRGLPR